MRFLLLLVLQLSRSSSETSALPQLAAAPAGAGMRPPGAHAGETKRVCAICLEHYEEGEKIRCGGPPASGSCYPRGQPHLNVLAAGVIAGWRSTHPHMGRGMCRI